MVESNITRRRVLQGAGAIGVGSLGSTVVSAQDGGGQDGQSAAVRVAHVSPDAPNVDVRLSSQDGGAGGGTGGNDTGAGGANQTTETGEQGGGGGGGTEISGLGFRSVSGYNEVDPGTYQVQIVPSEGGIGGFIQDIFGGGGEDEETVLFDGEIDVEEGTSYTVVAFGEVAQGPVPAEGAETDTETAGDQTDGGVGANATDNGGQNGTDGVSQNGTDGVGQSGTDGVGQSGTDGGGNETDGADADGGGQLVEELAFGESQTLEVDANDLMLEFEEVSAGGTTGGLGGDETDGVGTNETDGIETNGTGGTGMNETGGIGTGDAASGQSGGSGRSFQVQVLEDDSSDPGEGTARLRVFHAVPDVDAMRISQTSGGMTPTAGGAGGNGTGGAGANGTGDGAAGNGTGGVGDETGAGGDAGQEEGDAAGGSADQEDGGIGAGQNDSEGIGAGQNDTGGAGAGAQQQPGVRRASFSADGNSAYSGFATGYFDPQAAATAGGQGAGNETAGNETAGNATGGVGQDDTDGGNATGNQTDGEGEAIAEDAQGQEFEFLTVEDAQGGQRSDGGTGGLLDLASVADD